MNLGPEELATVLAALRFWQRQGPRAVCQPPEWSIATNEGTVDPLTEADIDGLCERLNVEDEAPKNLPEGDYVLTDEAAWLTVRNISVRIAVPPQGEGVGVYLFPVGMEADGELAAAHASFADATPFKVTDWQYEVANGYTKLGYAEWVEHKNDEADHGRTAGLPVTLGEP